MLGKGQRHRKCILRVDRRELPLSNRVMLEHVSRDGQEKLSRNLATGSTNCEMDIPIRV